MKNSLPRQILLVYFQKVFLKKKTLKGKEKQDSYSGAKLTHSDTIFQKYLFYKETELFPRPLDQVNNEP